MPLPGPHILTRVLRALPHWLRNLSEYVRRNRNPRFAFRWRNAYFAAHERYASSGAATGGYFHQDIWAARVVRERGANRLVDVGSRLDGFVGHVLPFCRVVYVDIRPPAGQVDGLDFVIGSVARLPFRDSSIPALSCLHVIEHIGLGRYGDPVEPDGHIHAAHELARVLGPGGFLVLGTPVGRERLCFDAHRIFDPSTILRAFDGLSLEEFSLIDDAGLGVQRNALFDTARRCRYGGGLFVFRKSAEAPR